LQRKYNNKRPILKAKTKEWIIEHLRIYQEEYSKGDVGAITFLYKLEGFADEPDIYMLIRKKEIEIGYVGIRWDGQYPESVKVKKYLKKYNGINLLDDTLIDNILEFLTKTIASRKRQYRTCQFCNEKVAPEHLYDKQTCHVCSSEHFMILY